MVGEYNAFILVFGEGVIAHNYLRHCTQLPTAGSFISFQYGLWHSTVLTRSGTRIPNYQIGHELIFHPHILIFHFMCYFQDATYLWSPYGGLITSTNIRISSKLDTNTLH
jgi:hypothetical protein